MRSIILSVALSSSLALLGLAGAFAQDDAMASSGSIKSGKLIPFEDDLDYLELNFTTALAKVGETQLQYETKLAEFEELSGSLQREASQAGLLSFVELRNEANVISDTYFHMKESLAKGERMPLVKLVSTCRRNRAGSSGSPENWAAFKCDVSLDEYYAPYESLESPGFSKVTPLEMIESIRNIRQMIGWMERDIHWEAAANNGKTFVLRNAPQPQFETSPDLPQDAGAAKSAPIVNAAAARKSLPMANAQPSAAQAASVETPKKTEPKKEDEPDKPKVKGVIPGAPDYEAMERRIRARNGTAVEISDADIAAPEGVNRALQSANLRVVFKQLSKDIVVTRNGLRQPKGDEEHGVTVILPGSVLEGEVATDLNINSENVMARDLKVNGRLCVNKELEAVQVVASKLRIANITSSLKPLHFYKSSFATHVELHNFEALLCMDSGTIGGSGNKRSGGDAVFWVSGLKRKLFLNMSKVKATAGAILLDADNESAAGKAKQYEHLSSKEKAKRMKEDDAPKRRASAPTLSFDSSMNIYADTFTSISSKDIEALGKSFHVVAKDNIYAAAY